MREARIEESACGAEHRGPRCHSIDFGFPVTLMTPAVSIPYLIAQVVPDDYLVKASLSLHFLVEASIGPQ